MSKERARRRAERLAQQAAELEARRARQERRERRLRPVRAVVDTARTALRRVGGRRRSRPDSALARQRARQDGLLLAVLVALNLVVWLAHSSWGWRLSALVLSAAAWPVLVVVLFDRRSSR